MVGWWKVSSSRPVGGLAAALTGFVLVVAATHASGNTVVAPTGRDEPPGSARPFGGGEGLAGRTAARVVSEGGPTSSIETTPPEGVDAEMPATTSPASTSTTVPTPARTVSRPPSSVPPTTPSPAPPVAPPPFAPPPTAPPTLADPAGGGYQLALPALFFHMVVRPSPNFTGAGLAAASDAVTELNSIVPAGWTVGPPLDGEPAYNEVKISFGDAAAACPGRHTGTVDGCTGAKGELLKSHAIYIVIDPSATASPKLLRHHVFHELGHAAGLDHFDGLINGKNQLMASSATEANAAVHFGPGDRNGIAMLTRNALAPLVGG